MSDPKSPASLNWRVVLGRVLLLATLVQIFLFFSGLLLPIQRVMTLWGHPIEERRGLVQQPWLAFKGIADKFPEDSRIYLIYPEQHVHDVVNYYFYPRHIAVSMTNSAYRIPEEYNQWQEMPDEEWLISNRYTHVLTFKDGGRAWNVQPGIERQIKAWEQQHANK